MSRRDRAAVRDVRIAAVRTLQGLVDGGGSLTRRLPRALAALAPADRARCQGFCYGLARWHIRLQAVAASLMKSPLKPKDQDLAWLIELGLYQLLHTDAPPSRVVDESVEATATLGKDWARGLVNAVLRRALRERDTLDQGLSEAQRRAHPAWLHERLSADWPADLQALCVANNTQAPMTLRIGPPAGGRDAYRAALAAVELDGHPLHEARQALQLVAPVPVERLPGFEHGHASVQDVSAQLAVQLLIDAVPAGARLLDACAAPGGKTGHAAQSGHFGDILALDNDAARLERVQGTLSRLGCTAAVRSRCADAALPDGWWDGQPFDAVLLDAPCSGSGVIRRHPDIKLLRRDADIAALVADQARLLDALWPLLAPGGSLLYATCSVLKVENEQQVQAFLARTPQAQAMPLPGLAGHPRPTQDPLGVQRLPGVHDGDGFWYARLTHRPSA